jgi:DNA-binding GntR family transcriptional regulator
MRAGLLECQMPVPDQRDAVQRRLLRDNAYTALRDAIVDEMLVPGERLHDEELCGWLGLSRTPVRNALSRLEEEGLVECRPQRYTRVTPLTRLQLREMFPVLAAMHALATELAVPRLGEAGIAALEREAESFAAAVRSRNAAFAHTADQRFHQVLLAAAANPEIVRVIERMTPRVRRLAHHLSTALPDRRAVAQHEAIISRVRAGNAVGAASAARENLMMLGVLFDRALGDEIAARAGDRTAPAQVTR